MKPSTFVSIFSIWSHGIPHNGFDDILMGAIAILFGDPTSAAPCRLIGDRVGVIAIPQILFSGLESEFIGPVLGTSIISFPFRKTRLGR